MKEGFPAGRILSPQEALEEADPFIREEISRLNSLLVRGQRLFSCVPDGFKEVIARHFANAGWYVDNKSQYMIRISNNPINQ